jgi:hypothetical protein
MFTTGESVMELKSQDIVALVAIVGCFIMMTLNVKGEFMIIVLMVISYYFGKTGSAPAIEQMEYLSSEMRQVKSALKKQMGGG